MKIRKIFRMILAFSMVMSLMTTQVFAMQWACGIHMLGGEEQMLNPTAVVSAESLQQMIVGYMESNV